MAKSFDPPVHRGPYQKTYRRMYSPKLTQFIEIHGDAAYMYWLQMEFDKDVLVYSVETEKLRITSNGRHREFKFDFCVTRPGVGDEYVYVWNDLVSQRNWKPVLNEWCLKIGASCRTYVKSDFLSQLVRLTSYQLILLHLGLPLARAATDTDIGRLLDGWLPTEMRTIGSIEQSVPAQYRFGQRTRLYHLLHRGLLVINWHDLFRANSKVWRA